MARSIASSSAARQNEQTAAQNAASMAGYIADMSSELSNLANEAELPMVAYFLNLARVEAEIRSRELGGRSIERSA
jgi:hypothetical protein